MGLVVAGTPPAAGTPLPLLLPGGVSWAQVVHTRRLAPGLWRLGLVYLPAPLAGAEGGVYLAA
jgi:cellulose synthase (UDP-forming)